MTLKGKAGEIFIDTINGATDEPWTIRIQDGITPGGHAIDLSAGLQLSLDSKLNKSVFDIHEIAYLAHVQDYIAFKNTVESTSNVIAASTSLTAGIDGIQITYAGGGGAALAVNAIVRKPLAADPNIFVTISNVAINTFTANFSSSIPNANYRLDYIVVV